MSAASVQPIHEDAEEIRRAATMIISHLQEEILYLTQELRESRAQIAEFKPTGTHLGEFNRCADQSPFYVVTVRYRRMFRFHGADAWPCARDFIKEVRHAQADEIMRRITEEETEPNV